MSSLSSSQRRQFVIKPFRPHCQMDDAQALVIWKSLRGAILEIYNHNASMLSFEELYRNAYNLVLHKHGDLLYDGVRGTIEERLRDVGAAVASSSDEALLGEVCSRWDEHRTTMEMVRDILMYMDRTYATQTKKLQVYDVGLVEFRGAVVRAVGARLQATLLDRVADERSRDVPVDAGAVRKALHMMVDLGAVDGTPFYEDEFEKPFLAETRRFYRSESLAELDRSSCPDYVAHVERRLLEEERRVSSYLHASTKHKLLKIAQKELVESHAATLVESERGGFFKLLRDNRLDDLRRLRSLFAKASHALDLQLCDALHSFVKRTGDDLVREFLFARSQSDDAAANAPPSNTTTTTTSQQQHKERQQQHASSSSSSSETTTTTTSSNNNRGSIRDPVAFVKAVLQMRTKYDDVVRVAFDSDTVAQKKLKDAFEALVNADPSRTATCLVVYVDELMRSGFKGLHEHDVEARLDDAVALFRYLHDKDVFENYYKQYLAKRLLGHKSASHEAEKMMLAKLKAECGYQFTTKLEGMFSDMRSSRDTVEKFRAENPAGAEKIDVTMLTQGFWPVLSTPRCALPDLVERHSLDTFEAFYLRVNSGRKLAWQTAQGSAEVRCHLHPPGSGPPLPGSGGGPTTPPGIIIDDNAEQEQQQQTPRRVTHDLVVSTYQMCILALFDRRTEPLSFSAVRDATRVQPVSDLKRHLVSLCTPKHRILLKESKGKGIADDDSFRVNVKFTSKLKRVRVPLVAFRDSVRESAMPDVDPENGLPRAVEEDRRHLVEANVVRIMKTRKVLGHNDLIAEVTRQLSHRFYPQPTFIKKCIESLLEREYIAREPDTRAYKYLA